MNTDTIANKAKEIWINLPSLEHSKPVSAVTQVDPLLLSQLTHKTIYII